MRTISKLLASLVLGLAFISSPSVTAEDSSVLCLAKNIYFEARGEKYAGKVAVAKVTLNRTQADGFPDSICGVVYQKYQFSWTSMPAKRITDKAAWQESLEIARLAVRGDLGSLSNFSALYFHNNTVRPKWKRRLIATIGNHRFYG